MSTSQRVTRAQWGARAPKRAGNLIGANPKGSAIHWEGPKMGTFPHSECAKRIRGVQDFHMDGRGWSDIAYNEIVCPHGVRYEGRGYLRGSAANGTTAANLVWFAICVLVGKGDPVSPAVLAAVRDAVTDYRAHGAGSAVTGHRDHTATECPGDQLYAEVRKGTFSTAPARVVKVISRAATKVRKAVSTSRVLQKGSRGSDVAALQRGLNLVFPAYSRLIVDGDFGRATDRVVRDFQRRSGLAVDGEVGPRTRAALKRAGVKF